MTVRFAELDRRVTPMGELSLRRRFHPGLEVDVWEVILGDEHLMSSLFTTSERALASLGLGAVDGDDLDVVVGGLGLGYTAREVLADDRVGRLRVIEALEPVVDWHRDRLLPDCAVLVDDPRCELMVGDFFALVAGEGFGDPVDAVLVDIDHTPRHVLDPSHAAFYEPAGLARLRGQLRPGGVFGLWSDDPPEAGFLDAVRSVFASCDAHEVVFPNPFTGEDAKPNTVYVAVAGDHR